VSRALPGFPERTLQVPAGVVLTNEEIALLLTQADERKRRGENWITVVDAPGADGYQVRVPRSAAVTKAEAIVALSRFDEAKSYQFSELLFVFSDGQVVKNHVLIKDRGLTGGRLTIMGPRRRSEF
jgi:hypothetical protein